MNMPESTSTADRPIRAAAAFAVPRRTLVAFAPWIGAVLIAAAPAAAQHVCSASEVEVTSLGIGGLSCRNCTLFHTDDPRHSRWEFGSEPVIESIVEDGPADGVLRAGDVIVAVDDHLITTQEGGRRLRRPVADRITSLRIRRDGREETVSIRPQPACEAPRQRATAVGVRERALPIDSVHVSGDVTSVYPSGSRPVTLPPLQPGGWLGLSFECSRCEVRLLADSATVWSFQEPPSIVSVETDGPADRAGLRSGDRIVSVDGHPMTSASGGERFGGLSPGETVAIGYQRGSRVSTTRMVVQPRPNTRPDGRSFSLGTSYGGDARSFTTGVVRYSGRIGDTMVEVTGEPVTVTQTELETIIRSSTITVRLRRNR